MMGFREVMKDIKSAKYCEFIDMYSHAYEGRPNESCPNKSIGICYHCKKRYCTFHGDRATCYDCRRKY